MYVPKPDSERRRHGKPQIPWTYLPAAGRTDPPPREPCSKLGERGQDWWDRAWRTPSASQWGLAEVDCATRRAQMEDMFAESPTRQLAKEMRAHETQLGLTFASRRTLRWQIVDVDGSPVEDLSRP